MNLDGIVEFVTVTDQRSFTLAGKVLGISTAKVSRKVTALERRLETKLLNRTTRVVTPTDMGQQFYHQCRHMLDQLGDAERQISAQQHTPSGKLTLTAPVTFGERIVAPIINTFLIENPRIEVSLNLTNQVLDLVQDNYDLAIRLGDLENSSLRARRLGARTLYTCASAAYFEQYGKPTTISELKQHQCIAGTSSHWQFTLHGKQTPLRVHPRLRCNSGIAIRDAARKGLGIVQLPDYYVSEDIKKGVLDVVLESYQIEDDGIWAVYPQTRHISTKVRLLLDYLVKKLYL
ncbi:LysR substrate-binding domain-containing protein [Alteromonas sp. C1M14]|uniref:LysR substrate-binding domain-containing protein n=1 Tax=Alteromonas sp. C1M14 TaxID=2841567 RepID=UPI001C0A0BCA|nr:LysR substrate-binding domain-containing protein [Alteromonas sp. C1M14]MBU2978181.1 LysR family transcriptional regulator [Alteromonas sp. C1M14]